MWENVKLGEVCDFQNGFAFKSSLFKEDGKPILRISNIQKDKIDVKKLVYFSDDDYDGDFRRYRVEQGDLLIAMSGATTGKLGFNSTNQVFYLNQRVGKFTPKEKLNKKYLYYLLSTKVEENLSISKGAAQPNLSTEQIKNIDFFMPPLAEQQRIVVKLDAAFAAIDEAVLYSKQNVNNAKRLYSYGIDEIFSPLIDVAQPLGRNSEINYGFTAKASFSEGTHKLLRITDIQDNSVDWDSVPFCNIEEKKLLNMLLYDGDIVFARTGATTGKSFLVEKPIDAVFASYLIRVSVDRYVLLPRYVMHFFQSETYWQQVNEGISGAAQGGFNASKLAELKIPIIPIEEQLNVIFRLDKLYEQTIQLKSIYENKLEQQKALQLAILAKELQSEAA